MITTVVSTDGSAPLEWQVELLAFSHRRVRQPGPLVVLRDTVEVAGDHYPPYNKPYALTRWVERERPATELVLVVDPDMIFTRPFAPVLDHGRPIAHDGTYRVSVGLARTLAPYTSSPSKLPSIAVPLVLRHSDLARLAPLWWTETTRLRADVAFRRRDPWMAEMWGCSVAATRLSLDFELSRLTAIPPFTDHTDGPFVHYSFPVDGFDKRSYRPWDAPPAGESPAYRQLRDLIEAYRRRLDPALRLGQAQPWE
jgi:hypothetical protein